MSVSPITVNYSQSYEEKSYVLFENHLLVRTRAKQRMKKRLGRAYENYTIGKINNQAMDQRLQSYLGILSHANQHELATALKNAYWIRSNEHENI